MINVSSLTQEKDLNKLYKEVDSHTNHIMEYLNTKNFSKCLVDTSSLISLLKIDTLTPSNYYILFNELNDIFQDTIEYYIREITLKDIKIKYLYDIVQQSQYLLPRLYLMIIVGGIYLEKYPNNYREILYDLINVVKCVQSPLRAFWLRYFLFNYIKDKLPYKNGDYINNKCYYFDYFNVSINFLMENLEYMNHYIIRVRKEIFIDDEILPINEREKMIISQKEIIEEISNMKNLTKIIFENKILPKFMKMIIFDTSHDWYIQKMLIESIIKFFKIDLYFESQGSHLILFCISKLMCIKEIDVATIFINLLKNYIKYIKAQKKLCKDNIIKTKAKNFFHIFLIKYNEIQMCYNNSGEKEFNKFTDLDLIFVRFVYKILEKNENQLKIINHIIDLCYKRIVSYKQQFNNDSFIRICLLIEKSLKKYTIYDLMNLDKIIIYLDYKNRKELVLNIIKSLVKSNKIYYLDDKDEIFQKLINLIIPLICEIKGGNNNNNGEENNYDDDDEQLMDEETINIYLCKLLSVFKSKKPEIMMEIFTKFYKLIISGSKENIIFVLPSIINYIISFMNDIEKFYKKRIKGIKDDDDGNNNTINNDIFDIGDGNNSKEKIDEYFIKLMKDIINQLKECISNIKKESNIKAFKYNLLIFSKMNKLQYIIELDKNAFIELFQYFFDEALNIWQNIKNDKDLNIKYNLFLYLCGYLPYFTKIIDKEKYNKIIEIFENEIPNITDVKFKYEIIINIGDIYFLINKNKEKVNQYINKVLEIIKNNLESIDNIRLLIKLINKIKYYIEEDEKDDKFISIEIEVLNSIIKDMKNKELFKEEKMSDELKEIYEYYKNTEYSLIQRKKDNKNNIYSSLII